MDDRRDRPKTFPFTLLVFIDQPHGRFQYDPLPKGLHIVAAWADRRQTGWTRHQNANDLFGICASLSRPVHIVASELQPHGEREREPTRNMVEIHSWT